MNNFYSKITPVFYFGAQRSGTTWLGNILAFTFRIPTAKHPLHYGVDESAIYRIKKYWGDLVDPDDYIRFLELYASSDYFLLVGGDKDFFYRHPIPDFYEFYLQLMDQFAAKLGSDMWMTKLDPAFFRDEEELRKFEHVVNRRYENVKFVYIKRNYRDYIQSYLNMGGNAYSQRQSLWRKYLAIFTGTAYYFFFNRSMEQFAGSRNGLSISYEALSGDYSGSLDRLSAFLQVEPKNDLSSDRGLPKNTSFAKRKKRTASFFIPVSEFLFEKSDFLAKWITRLRSAFRKPKNPLFWRLLKAKYFESEFKTELEQSGQQQLIEYINEPILEE